MSGGSDIDATNPNTASKSEEHLMPGSSSSSITDAETFFAVPTISRRERRCWVVFLFLLILSAVASLIVVNFMWDVPVGQKVRVNALEYLLFCLLGGALSGLSHAIVTPLDLVKCRIQVGEYKGAREGFAALGIESLNVAPFHRKMGIWYRGWAPALLGYFLHGTFKFGFYEYFKYQFASLLSNEFVTANMFWVLLAASATSEFIADVVLAPWEAVKVRIQTAKAASPVLRLVMPRMWVTEGTWGFFKGLTPLWGRQVPFAVFKYLTFETLVELIFTYFIQASHEKFCGVHLTVSLFAGYVSGVLCAIVSHPADTIVSRLNQRGDTRSGLHSVFGELPFRDVWRGLVLRIVMVGTLTGLQWLLYDAFLLSVGLPTTRGWHS